MSHSSQKKQDSNLFETLKLFERQTILDLFPTARITHEGRYTNVEILCATTRFNKISFRIFLSENKSVMEIESLDKCGTLSGTTVLKNLINIAEQLQLDEIRLLDGSTIPFGIPGNLATILCSVSLAPLYILLHGISWYNKFGFVSKTFLQEKQANDILRHNRFDIFIQKVEDKVGKYTYFDDFETYFEDEIYNDDDTIAEVMSRIHSNYLKHATHTVCDDPKFIMLRDLLYDSKQILHYNNNLTLTLK
jgi:hypothetical protein